MARLNETQFVFVLGFWCACEWSRREFRQEMKESQERDRVELKRHVDRVAAEQEHRINETLEQLDKKSKREYEKMAHTTECLFDALGAAIKAISDHETQLKVRQAIDAELARLGADGTAQDT